MIRTKIKVFLRDVLFLFISDNSVFLDTLKKGDKFTIVGDYTNSIFKIVQFTSYYAWCFNVKNGVCRWVDPFTKVRRYD